MATPPNEQSARRQALLEKMLQKGGVGAAASAITRLPRDTNRFPASHAQHRTWFMDQLSPGTSAFNNPITYRLLGSVDVEALERSLNFIVDRHEALRTHFETVDGVLYQVIDPPRKFTLNKVDLRDITEPERHVKARELVQAAERRPFDLAGGQLFSALLVILTDDESGFVLNMHHIIADGWSHGIILRELDLSYTSFSSGSIPEIEPPAFQYADIAHWQFSRSYDRDLTYWKEALATPPPPIELSLDRARPARQTYSGASVPVCMPFDAVRQLKELGQTEGASSFMTLLAVFKVLLLCHTNQTDIIVGTTTTGRTRKEEPGVIGDFVNILALRTSLAGNPTFRDLLRRVRTSTTGAYAHQSAPFEKVVESLPPSRSRLFHITFGMNSLSMPDIAVVTTTQIGQVNLGVFQEYSSTWSKLDLTTYLWETPSSLEGYVEYNTDIFDRETITTFLEDYNSLSAQIAANPDLCISEYHVPERPKTPKLDKPELFLAPTSPIQEPTNALEQTLCEIWAETLGLECVGIDDNFFDLGGYSLLAFRLVASMKKAIDAPLSVAETFKAPTIRSMARIIKRKQSGSDAWSPLVALKPSGSRRPLFCAPVYGGSAFYYRTLASHMDEDQPLYALEPIGLNGIDDPHTTIEEMASYYIDHVRMLQPQGPYALCGLSLGGTIAFEMGRQLADIGQEVACLVMVDTLAPGLDAVVQEPNPGTLRYEVRNMRYKILSQFEGVGGLPSVQERVQHIAKVQAKISGAVRNKLQGKQWKESYRNPNSTEMPEVYQKLIEAEERALSIYHPAPYEGRITLLKAKLDEPGVRHIPKLGWEAFAPNLEVVVTPGTHYTMLEEPCVRTTAGHIRKLLKS
jgi:thioesterase domain-containing protein